MCVWRGDGCSNINIIKIRQQTKGEREVPVKHPKQGQNNIYVVKKSRDRAKSTLSVT